MVSVCERNSDIMRSALPLIPVHVMTLCSRPRRWRRARLRRPQGTPPRSPGVCVGGGTALAQEDTLLLAAAGPDSPPPLCPAARAPGACVRAAGDGPQRRYRRHAPRQQRGLRGPPPPRRLRNPRGAACEEEEEEEGWGDGTGVTLDSAAAAAAGLPLGGGSGRCVCPLERCGTRGARAGGRRRRNPVRSSPAWSQRRARRRQRAKLSDPQRSHRARLGSKRRRGVARDAAQLPLVCSRHPSAKGGSRGGG